jgi:two-component system, chemotaxis family, sensor kinase CheA
MDLRRFLDLYIAEGQEHVRLLQRSLLELETDDSGVALEEAFRAAHTLKGNSAAMGYGRIAEMAHALEDRLAGVRSGGLRLEAALVDSLLSDADALESAVHAAAGGGAPVTGAPGADTAPRAGEPDDGGAVVPAHTAWVATVHLRADTPLAGVRALLVVRALEDQPDVLGSDPTTFDEGFDGRFRIFLGPAADVESATAAIRGAGDVEAVHVSAVDRGAGAAGRGVAGTGAGTGGPRVRVAAARLDEIAEAVAELSVLFARFVPREAAPGALPDATGERVDRMGVVLAELQHRILQLRMAPVRLAFERLPRAVRDAARTLGRDVELLVSGDDVELDRAIIDEIADPLLHLLRNAVDHGIEDAAERSGAGKNARGRVRLHAERERSSVCITVSDDGRGVHAERVVRRARAAGILAADAAAAGTDEEVFRLLSHPGLSTADEVSAVSGRGVGLDVVVHRVRALGGAISMQTVPGAGTTFTIRLPITLALAKALHVRVGSDDYVIPLTHISEVVELNGSAGAGTVELRGESIRLVHLRTVLHAGAGHGEATAIVAGMGDRRAALAVDELVGHEQILVKSFDGVAGMLPYFSGATLLGDGRPALVLDPLSVI